MDPKNTSCIAIARHIDQARVLLSEAMAVALILRGVTTP
jgi:hypothetical protein